MESDTVHAHGLLVLLAVQLQSLQMEVTYVPTRFGAPALLFQEGLTRGTERAVGDGLILLELRPTHRTLPVELPASLQAFSAEGVSAGQQYGVSVDALADRACQVLLKRKSLLWHIFIHVVSHDFTQALFTSLSICQQIPHYSYTIKEYGLTDM